MDITKYHYELLSILDEVYPNLLTKNAILSILSDKNPDKLDREIAYLSEHGLIEKKEPQISGMAMVSVIFRGYKITAKGIDFLKEISKPQKTSLEQTREKVKRPVAFISSTFNDGADGIIKWVRNRADNAGLNTIWLKEVFKVRPTIEKIDQAISESDCFIQILTSYVFENKKEMGWIGNEIGMAYKSRPGRNIAVFVEEDNKPSGIADSKITDIFSYNPEKLADSETKAEEYLRDLRIK